MKGPLLGRYFGSKFRSAKRYPEPKHSIIIEPFAGGAGYSCRYTNRQIVLCEKNPQIAGIWRWLIGASPEEIRALPIHEPGEYIHASVTGPARDWIGLWNAFGQVRPQEKMVPSAGGHYGSGRPMRGFFWNETFRDRTAESVGQIRHWIVFEGSYESLPNLKATWFVDPPYINLDLYKQGTLDYSALAQWCVLRKGQVIVCENEGADWLPFVPFANLHAAPRKGKGRRTKEAICTWDSDVFC